MHSLRVGRTDTIDPIVKHVCNQGPNGSVPLDRPSTNLTEIVEASRVVFFTLAGITFLNARNLNVEDVSVGHLNNQNQMGGNGAFVIVLPQLRPVDFVRQ